MQHGCLFFEVIMSKIKRLLNYFSKGELVLWICSLILITVSFFIFDKGNYLNLIASLVGVSALIFCAKGNPAGQALMIVFCVLYGIISFGIAYYGEMITYLGMSLPMAILSLVSWVRNSYGSDIPEVKVNRLKFKEIVFALALTAAVSFAFYFILKAFNTNNLITSTFSVATSFIAAYLTFRRSPYFALAYAVNDIVLIVLWIMATLTDVSYLSVVICFAAFLANDIYGFFNWLRMERRQRGE